MPSWVLLLLAVASSHAGMGYLALAMTRHFTQVRGSAPSTPAIPRTLRLIGSSALLLSLLLCFLADHPSMAPLVWVMSVTASALSVALTLAFRPRLLAVLIPFAR